MNPNPNAVQLVASGGERVGRGWIENKGMDVTMKITAGATAILAALISFFVTAQAVSALLWRVGLEAHDLSVRVKPAIEDKNTDVLFIGTSHMTFGADPVTFDSVMAEKGHPTRSYNIAYEGESIVEMQSVLERFFDAHPCCVKYVVMEVDFSAFGSIHSPRSIRAISFFDVVNAARFLRYYDNKVFQSTPILTPSEYRRNILTALAIHYTNAGLASVWLGSDAAIGREHRYDAEAFRRGVVFYDNTLKFSDETARNNYIRDIDGLANANSEVGLNVVTDYQVHLVLAVAALVRSRGAEPVLIRMPYVGYAALGIGLLNKLHAWCRDAAPLLMDFGNPNSYEWLYDAEYRFDTNHLNTKGAIRFTNLLANQMVAAMEEGSLPMTSRPICTGPSS